MMKINFQQLNFNEQKVVEQTPADVKQKQNIAKQNVILTQLTPIQNVEQTMIDLLQTSISHIAKKDKMTETNRSFIFDEQSRIQSSRSKDKPIGAGLKKIKQQIINSMSQLSESRQKQKKQCKERQYGKIKRKQSPIKIQISQSKKKEVGFIVIHQQQQKVKQQKSNDFTINNNIKDKKQDKMKGYVNELKSMGNKKINNVKPFKGYFEQQEIQKKHDKDLIQQQQKSKAKGIHLASKHKQPKTIDPRPVVQTQPNLIPQPYRSTPANIQAKLYNSITNTKSLQDIYIQRLTNKLFMKNKTLTIQPNTISRLVQQQFKILYPFLHNAQIQQKPLTKQQFKRQFLTYYLNLSTDKRRILKSIHQRQYQSVMDSIKK